jgi:hypothetical protein
LDGLIILVKPFSHDQHLVDAFIPFAIKVLVTFINKIKSTKLKCFLRFSIDIIQKKIQKNLQISITGSSR